MAQGKETKAARLPHKMRKKLHELTGFAEGSISRIISAGEVEHPVWTAYEKLLKEELEAKEQQRKAKQERIANAKKLQAQLAA